jgi:hypothetical protein
LYELAPLLPAATAERATGIVLKAMGETADRDQLLRLFWLLEALSPRLPAAAKDQAAEERASGYLLAAMAKIAASTGVIDWDEWKDYSYLASALAESKLGVSSATAERAAGLVLDSLRKHSGEAHPDPSTLVACLPKLTLHLPPKTTEQIARTLLNEMGRVLEGDPKGRRQRLGNWDVRLALVLAALLPQHPGPDEERGAEEAADLLFETIMRKYVVTGSDEMFSIGFGLFSRVS